MILDKGRGRHPDEEKEDDSLEAKLMVLAEMKLELREKKQEFQQSTKHLRESIKSLENIVSEEVKQRRQTVTVGNIRAEYIPQVVIKMKKEKNDGE